MKLRGSLLVIVCCLIVEVCNLSLKEFTIYAGVVLEARILAFAFEGVLFMLYPLVGHLTDVYLTRYRRYHSKRVFVISTDLLDRIELMSSKDYFPTTPSCCYGVAM